MSVAAKICGLNDEAGIAAAIAGGARFVGFVFYPPSPRGVSPARAKMLAAAVPVRINVVALVMPSPTTPLSGEYEAMVGAPGATVSTVTFRAVDAVLTLLLNPLESVGGSILLSLLQFAGWYLASTMRMFMTAACYFGSSPSSSPIRASKSRVSRKLR